MITNMATNPIFRALTKHIELNYHFVKERVKLGSHKVLFIPSVDQLVDGLTKGLSKQATFSPRVPNSSLPDRLVCREMLAPVRFSRLS